MFLLLNWCCSHCLKIARQHRNWGLCHPSRGCLVASCIGKTMTQVENISREVIETRTMYLDLFATLYLGSV